MTYYYPFKFPVTSLGVHEVSSNHIKINVFIKGQNAGTLTIDHTEKADILKMFTDNDSVAYVTAIGGGESELVIKSKLPKYLISEYGEIISSESLKEQFQHVKTI